MLRSGQSVSAQDVIDFVAQRIARYKRPKHVVFAAALPKTASGAIDRSQVKDAFRDA